MPAEQISILATPGFIPDAENRLTSDLIKLIGANSGNLLFQFAVDRLIGGSKVHVWAGGISYSDKQAYAGSDLCIMPAANHLRAGADWKAFAQYLSRIPVPLIVLGLGAQAPLGATPSQTIDTLKRDEGVMALVEVLAKKSIYTSVRGEFSRAVADGLGLRDTEILGCPSILLNPEPKLGQVISNKLSRLTPRFWRRDPVVAISAAAPFEFSAPGWRAVERQLFKWVHACNGIYVQQSGGVAMLDLALKRFSDLPVGLFAEIHRALAPSLPAAEFKNFISERQQLFFSAQDWINQLGAVDAVIGTRLHGNLAGIAAGLPAVFVANDARTEEVIAWSSLPSLSAQDVLEADKLSTALAKVQFDQHAFDSKRLATAKAFASAMTKVGVKISDHTQALATSD